MSVEDDHDAVHSPDNCTHTCRRTWDQVSAFRHRLAFSVSFPEHVHEENQIMWITQGSAMISSAMGSWMVAPGNAIWMPADTVHTMAMAAPAEFHSVYLMPEVGLRESRWAFSHTFEMDDLLAALIGRLELRTLSDVQREDASTFSSTFSTSRPSAAGRFRCRVTSAQQRSRRRFSVTPRIVVNSDSGPTN